MLSGVILVSAKRCRFQFWNTHLARRLIQSFPIHPFLIFLPVVLVDEKTSSDGEGVSRGISELGLGKIVGTRTWGGGIWLSSDNHLVDGGIATVSLTMAGGLS